MRIIGKTEDGFILDASKADVAALETLYKYEKQFNVGDAIDIEKLFSKVRSIQAEMHELDRINTTLDDIKNNIKWLGDQFNGIYD